MPTVEELLASQRAETERQSARIRELESSLQLAQGTISSQGEQLHAENVAKRVTALNGKVAPSVLERAQAVWLSDKTGIVPGESDSLALSVATTEDGQAKTLELASPSAIVDFILAGMPAEKGEAAQILASVTSGLEDVQAAQHASASASQQYESWERENHPERFDSDGKRLDPAAA